MPREMGLSNTHKVTRAVQACSLTIPWGWQSYSPIDPEVSSCTPGMAFPLEPGHRLTQICNPHTGGLPGPVAQKEAPRTLSLKGWEAPW